MKDSTIAAVSNHRRFSIALYSNNRNYYVNLIIIFNENFETTW